MPAGLQLADHIIIAGYFIFLTAIGVYFWKRMRHVRDFFTGGNAIPWWLAGVSFYLTGFSAFTFVAYSEMAYRYGFIAVTLAWSSAVGMVVGTFLLASRWRRARILSPIEFLEARYNKQIRQVLAWAGLPLKVIDDGLKIYATGVFVSVGMGYDLKISIIVSGAVMLLYTFMGGLWAVVVTDYIQFIILTLGVVVLFPLVFAEVGSFGALATGAQAGFLSPVGAPFSLLYVLAFYLLIVLSYNRIASVMTEDIYRRLFHKDASQRRLVIVGRIATLVIGAITISIGVTLIATARRGLFEVMVTVFGIFIGPMLIPMLLGLLSRQVTWRGAAAGITAGLISGLSFYFYKTLVLAKQPGIDLNWLRYDYEAISILTNFAITLLAILLMTLFAKVSARERVKIDEFFVRLSTPIDVSQTHARVTGEVFSPFYIIGWITGGTGLLLLIASAVQPSGIGQYINLASGIVICLLGYGFYHLHRRVMHKEAGLAREAARSAKLAPREIETNVLE